MRLRFLVTMGDPFGIGPEVAVKALAALKSVKADIHVVGLPDVLKAALSGVRGQGLGVRGRGSRATIRLRRNGQRATSEYKGQGVGIGSGRSRVFDSILERTIVPEGIRAPRDFRCPRVDPEGGKIAVACLRKAVDEILAGRANALVTAPICKESVKAAGFPWPGHTEMLAEWSGTSRYAMMFAGPRLKVSLVTIHAALADVPRLVTADRVFDVTDLTHTALKRFFGIRSPRLAVAGLNPHAGEGGEFGREDLDVIQPAVEKARKLGMRVDGPLPADTLFYKLYRRHYDGAVCMYHDQALAAFKMVHFNTGVNLTLGLPFVRTSPDHGTAFDIAWKNRADESAMVSAIRCAVKLSGPAMDKKRGRP